MIDLLNNDAIYSYGIIWLESTFILATLLILHWLRRLIGSGALYLVLGIILVFAHLMAAAGIRFLSADLGIDLGVSSSAIILPCLATFLVIYIIDGTLAAQRIVISVMIGLGMLLYLRYIGVLECSWPGYSISQGVLADFLRRLLSDTTKHMASSTIALTFDMFLMPFLYQQMQNWKCRQFISFTMALILGQLVDSFIFLSVYYWGSPHSLLSLWSQLFPQILMSIWLAMITNAYLLRINHEIPRGSRSPLEIFFAFFGAYGQAKLLEQNLRESEQRYRTMIQSAGDLIFIADANGSIIDANKAALSAFGLSNISDAIGEDIQELAGIPMPQNGADQLKDGAIFRVKLPGKQTELELRVGKISIAGTLSYAFFGRDITERERLNREREAWRAEYAHRQRLEAIGRLAGGIAHDFNNHLHAIQGHLDLIYMEGASEENMTHLEKIDRIAQQAAKLTGQLLGYARKGRRQNQSLSLERIIRNALELFLPDARSGIRIQTTFSAETIHVFGDETQLQQGLLNLMLNARDAMKNQDADSRKLTISSGLLSDLHLTPAPPPEVQELPPSELCGIRVTDTGPGVPRELLDKIFEPFFTTKPVGQGTGMGLSMCCGVALEHGGWVQYDDKDGGASFTIVLPVEKDSALHTAG